MNTEGFENLAKSWAWNDLSGWADELDNYFSHVAARCADKTIMYEV